VVRSSPIAALPLPEQCCVGHERKNLVRSWIWVLYDERRLRQNGGWGVLFDFGDHDEDWTIDHKTYVPFNSSNYRSIGWLHMEDRPL